jgi:hypothetical protein
MLAPKLHHVASGEFSRTASCPVFTHFGSEAVERPRGSADRALLSASQALSVAMRSANYLPHRFSAFVRHHTHWPTGSLPHGRSSDQLTKSAARRLHCGLLARQRNSVVIARAVSLFPQVEVEFAHLT